MTLLFIDGWKHYTTTDALKKWTSNGGYAISISNTGGPTGGGYCYGSTARPYWLKTLSAKSEWWLGCRVRWDGTGGQPIFNLWDSGTFQTAVAFATGGYIVALRGHSQGTVLTNGTSTVTVQNGIWHYYEAHFVLSQTVGTVEVRMDGVTIITTSAQDVCNATNATADSVGFASNADTRSGAFTDFYAADNGGSQTYLGDVKVETIYPSGAGNSTVWTPNTGANYAAVDDAQSDGDTTYVSSSSAGDIDTYAFGDLATSAGTIYAVQHNLMARKDDAGSRSIAPMVRHSSTDYAGTTVALGDTYSDIREIQVTNPGTSSAWSISDVNSAEFGVKLIA